MDRWQRTAWVVWGLIVAAGVGRAALYHLPRHCGCYDIFAAGGRHWLAGELVYDLDHSDSLTVFRNSPLVAAACAPLALLSAPAGSAALRLVNFAALITGLAWWGRTVLPSPTDRAKWWLLVALAGGPALLDVQLNLLTVGLMLIGAAAFSAGRLNVSAVAISLAVCLKAYPVALGLLFVLIAPRRFGPRFAAALAVTLALPFALQSPGYVAAQYHDWLHGGLSPRYVDGAFQDVMHLWQRWVGPMDRPAYTLLSVAAGAAVGLVILAHRRRPVEDQAVGAFGLATAWMMAFGPATEGTTYVQLAPAAALAAVRSGRTAVAAYVLLALAQVQLLFPLGRPLHRVGAQPLAALLLITVFARWRQAEAANAVTQFREPLAA